MKLKHVKTITKRVLRSSTFDQWTVSPHLLVGWAAPKIWQRLCSHTVPCRVTAATEAAWRRTPVGDSGAIVSSAQAMRQFREIWVRAIRQCTANIRVYHTACSKKLIAGMDGRGRISTQSSLLSLHIFFAPRHCSSMTFHVENVLSQLRWIPPRKWRKSALTAKLRIVMVSAVKT